MPQARRALRDLLLPGQRRIHTADESDRRRRALLREAAALLLEAKVQNWVLDDVPPAQRARDRDTIARVVGRRLVYDHRRNHTEPLLWVADAVAWAVGAGDRWRAQLGEIVTIRNTTP